MTQLKPSEVRSLIRMGQFAGVVIEVSEELRRTIKWILEDLGALWDICKELPDDRAKPLLQKLDSAFNNLDDLLYKFYELDNDLNSFFFGFEALVKDVCGEEEEDDE